MGHPQPPTPVHVDNTTAVGIVNNTIKRQRSRAMEMRYFWLLDQKNNKYLKVWYKPGAENMGDYPTKAHTGAIHQHVRPYYLQMPNSPRTLLRADKPSSRRGCVELLGSPYYKGVPLPRIPNVTREPGIRSRVTQRTLHPSVGTRDQLRRSKQASQYVTVNRNSNRSRYATEKHNGQLKRAVGPVGSVRGNTRRVTVQLRTSVKQ